MTTTVLIYARASKDPGDQRISVDRQAKLCTARANELWPDAEVRVFRDDGITAADPDRHRPGFADFLRAVRTARKGEIAGIVVNEQSRLTRQGTNAWDELVVSLTKAGVAKVETLRNGPISVEPGNRLTGRLLAVIDAEEVERTKARVQDAHRELFNEGRPSGRAPYGYRSTRGEDGRPALEPDPVEGAVVKQVFAMALQGYSIAAITESLNAAKTAPPSAGWKWKDGRSPISAWYPSTVRILLKSKSVAGLRSMTDEDGNVQTMPARWAQVALVDVDEWRQVQRMLGQPTAVTGVNGDSYWVRSKPRERPRSYLLSGGQRRGDTKGQKGDLYGILRCGKCDHPLVAGAQRRRGGGKVHAYSCSTAIGGCGGTSIGPADELEDRVVKAIQIALGKNSKLRKRLDGVQDGEAGRWRAERDAAQATMVHASDLYGRGEIDSNSWRAMHSPAKARFEAAEAHLAGLTSDLTLPSAEDVIQRWQELTLRQQRAAVERLIRRIVVSPSGDGRPHSGFNADRVGEPEWLA